MQEIETTNKVSFNNTIIFLHSVFAGSIVAVSADFRSCRLNIDYHVDNSKKEYIYEIARIAEPLKGNYLIYLTNISFKRYYAFHIRKDSTDLEEVNNDLHTMHGICKKVYVGE